MSLKPIKFVGSSLDDLRNFPDEARRAAGFELRAVQSGLDPSDWKSMQAIGPGAKEIRIHVLGEWRVIYVAKLLMQSTCFIHLRKRVKERVGKISNWLAKDTSRSEDNL
jgi:phage-related protein